MVERGCLLCKRAWGQKYQWKTEERANAGAARSVLREAQPLQRWANAFVISTQQHVDYCHSLAQILGFLASHVVRSSVR